MSVVDSYFPSHRAAFSAGNIRGSGVAPIPNVYRSGTRTPTISPLPPTGAVNAGMRSMTRAEQPSKASSVTALLSVVLIVVGVIGELVSTNMTFGALAALGFAVLAAIVIAYEQR